MTNFFEEIKKFFVEERFVEEEKVTSDASIKDLGLDSLEQTDAIIDLEDKFDISISAEEQHGIKTVGDLANLIGEKKK